MVKSEFIERTGFESTAAEYNELYSRYTAVKDERDTAVAKLVSIKNFL